MEQLIIEELELFITLIKKTEGESFDCINKFNFNRNTWPKFGEMDQLIGNVNDDTMENYTL